MGSMTLNVEECTDIDSLREIANQGDFLVAKTVQDILIRVILYLPKAAQNIKLKICQ
jgi:stalled ribosome rescue protein Dom34